MIGVAIDHSSRDLLPALSTYHVPLLARVDLTTDQQVYFSLTEGARLSFLVDSLPLCSFGFLLSLFSGFPFVFSKLFLEI